MDIPHFPYKMQILNRIFTDAHYIVGLENHLKGFDLVHTAETYFRYTQQCLDAKKHGLVKKVITTVWETIAHNNEGIWGRKAYKDRARKELDHFIAVTQKAKEALVSEGVDPDWVTVLGAHIDTERFSPPADWPKRLSNPNKRAFTILFCGRMEVEKGMLDVLDAASLLSTDPLLTQYQLTWLLVGDGSLKRTLTQGIGKNWHFRLLSATYDQMPNMYREADIYVAPSKPMNTWEEQYGMALLEAQASGLPIVTTETGGIPENVGDAAIRVPPGDVQTLATEIKDFLLNPKKRKMFGVRARRRAESIHDIRVGAHKLAAIYERVLRDG